MPRYRAHLSVEDGIHVIASREANLVTEGRSPQHALEMLRDVIALMTDQTPDEIMIDLEPTPPISPPQDAPPSR